jgi:hypothetical protein
LRRELTDAERLFLCAPKKRQIGSAGETYHAKVRRLVAFCDRLDDPQ